MMPGKRKAILALGLCLVASQGIAQQGPPPGPPQQPPPPPPPQQQQPPPGQGDGDEPRRDPGTDGPPRLSWYNGDYSAGSISSVMTIDDPVTGFGNEALWTNPEPLSDLRQSDIAGSAEPD